MTLVLFFKIKKATFFYWFLDLITKFDTRILCTSIHLYMTCIFSGSKPPAKEPASSGRDLLAPGRPSRSLAPCALG